MRNAIFVIFFLWLLVVVSACRFDGVDSADLVPAAGTRSTPNPELTVTEDLVVLGTGEGVRLVTHAGKGETPFYLNLHDNENTAVEAALTVVGKSGGRLAELRHTGNRLIEFSIDGKSYRFDPNRMFSSVGVSKNLALNHTDFDGAATEIGKLSKKVIDEYVEPNKELVITVHNNTDNGGLTVNTYSKDDGLTTAVHVEPGEDPDDFFLVTKRNHFERLKAAGFNTVLQDNSVLPFNRALDDGSLSIYCGIKNIPYINVESEHGHLVQQVKMLEALRRITADLDTKE